MDRLWIVVADGGQARVLGIAADRRGLNALREMTSVDAHRRSQDLASDRPGRSFESANPTRHAIAPRQDPHEEARERFISQLALMLSEDNRAGQFDELILIVAPGLSGTLRDALDEPTRARVRETLVKDLDQGAGARNPCQAGRGRPAAAARAGAVTAAPRVVQGRRTITRRRSGSRSSGSRSSGGRTTRRLASGRATAGRLTAEPPAAFPLTPGQLNAR